MSRLPRVKPKQAIKALKKMGFILDHTTGSHHIFYKEDVSHPITVPFHNKDLRLGTISEIIKSTGLTVKEFNEFL